MRPPASSSGSWRVHGSIGGGVGGIYCSEVAAGIRILELGQALT